MNFKTISFQAGAALFAATLLLMAFLGCSPKVAVPEAEEDIKTDLIELIVHTNPPGGTVFISETGDSAPDGKPVQLLPGMYNLKAQLEGYRDGHTTVTVDKAKPKTIELPLGPGFAAVRIISHPEGASIHIEKDLGPAPVDVELEAGTHLLNMTLDGFFPLEMPIVVEPGISLEVIQTLEPLPTHAPVKVKTDPPGAEIYWKNRKVGVSKADLGPVAFGRYTVTGVKNVDVTTRMTGKAGFEVNTANPLEVVVALDRRERHFEGKWLNEKEALAREETRYRLSRVKNPVLVEVKMNESVKNDLDRMPDPDRALHGVLRVGDRVRFVKKGGHWLIWKRSPSISEDFSMAVEALKNESFLRLPWTDDNVGRKVSASTEKSVLAEIAFGLHRARTDFPVIDLNADQLQATLETFPRSSADGEITIIARGGKGLVVPEIKPAVFEDISIFRVPAGSEPVTLRWSERPVEVMAVCDRSSGLPPMQVDSKLQVKEKKIVGISGGKNVHDLIRLSSGPDYGNSWNRRGLKPSGPLADQVDLSRDEIGPHEQPGHYQRIWLIRFRENGGLTQRQIGVSYQVGQEIKDFSSDKFLRRKEPN